MLTLAACGDVYPIMLEQLCKYHHFLDSLLTDSTHFPLSSLIVHYQPLYIPTCGKGFRLQMVQPYNLRNLLLMCNIVRPTFPASSAHPALLPHLHIVDIDPPLAWALQHGHAATIMC